MVDRQILVSERAHLMCPDMQFAVCAGLTDSYERGRAEKALAALRGAHPFLSALIARDADRDEYYYDVGQAPALDILEKPDFARVLEDYCALRSRGWDATREGLLRVIFYPEENGFHALFVAHHLLCDGRGLLGLMREFARAYSSGQAPARVEERLLHSQADLPKGSELPFVSRLLVRSANRHWAKEHQHVSYEEYLAFEKQYLSEHPASFTLESRPAEPVAARCRENGVTVNDLLVAEMMLQAKSNKVVIAADIRADCPAYREGAMGNYATALSVVSPLKTDDVLIKAKDVSRRVKAALADLSKKLLVLSCYFAMSPSLLDAAAISALGGFSSRAGAFVGAGMFGMGRGAGLSLTNLGRLSEDGLTDAMFIPPLSPAARKVTGVVTAHDTLALVTGHIDTKDKEK